MIYNTGGSEYINAYGGGGGAGVWFNGYCAGNGGSGGSTSTTGTPTAGGTWTSLTSQSGANGVSTVNSGSGGGSADNTQTAPGSQAGGVGYLWVDGNRYGGGGNGGNFASIAPGSVYGNGAQTNVWSPTTYDAQNGVFIVRY